eukprot:NODE_118_length_3592_cov_50.752666_g100_i0.p1 GENE.NODE_118_length_3592_cov_50.752666_g100_i0~~NODE_118_length_3592_cov_50.752666_g100_i0.p1  ORF type:complete len:1162 (-),score=251.75 NODE_118_length_3592_cov_50.752666_g100_i0:106-3072(-)
MMSSMCTKISEPNIPSTTNSLGIQDSNEEDSLSPFPLKVNEDDLANNTNSLDKSCEGHKEDLEKKQSTVCIRRTHLLRPKPLELDSEFTTSNSPNSVPRRRLHSTQKRALEPHVLSKSKKITLPTAITPAIPMIDQTLKDQIISEILPQVIQPDDIVHSFESKSFPYFMSEDTKSLLKHMSFVHLKKPQMSKYLPYSNSPIGRAVLLSGPPGSEVFQEVIARSIAKNFGAYFLAFDRLAIKSLPPPVEDESPPSSTTIPTNSTSPFSRTITLGTPFSSFLGGCSSKLPAPKSFKQNDRVIFSPSVWSLQAKSSASGNRNGPMIGCRGKVVHAFEDNPRRQKIGVQFDNPIPGGTDLGGLCSAGHGFFASPSDLVLENDKKVASEHVIVDALFDVISKHHPFVLFFRDPEGLLFGQNETFMALKKAIETLTTPCLILGRSIKQDSKKNVTQPRSRTLLPETLTILPMDLDDDLTLPSDPLFPLKNYVNKKSIEIMKPRVLLKFFATVIDVNPLPEEVDVSTTQAQSKLWRKQLQEDTTYIKTLSICKTLRKVMDSCNVKCLEFNSLLDQAQTGNCCVLAMTQFKPFGLYGDVLKTTLTLDSAKQIVSWTVSKYLQDNNTNEQSEDTPLEIQPKHIQYAMELFNRMKSNKSFTKLKDAQLTDNEYEKRLISEVIQPSQINVTFDQIGSHDKVKQMLSEVVLLPLTRPGLFTRSSLLKPCKGMLLFGPPGTGKTMLAKAIATEARAHFINITMGVITSKWFGEAEKLVAAVFSLARKLAPSIIFIDEVDAMLGKRSSDHEHETMRKLKNEFMSAWDGLKSQDYEQVMVLAATNRPGDLDDAVLRRMPRRILVDLPDVDNRKQILQVILKDEDLCPNVDFDALAQVTSNYSGSDLKQMCIAAAYRPVREYLRTEYNNSDKSSDLSNSSDALAENDSLVKLRPLKMEDFNEAIKEVGASLSEEALSINELRKWNELYGDGGSRSAREKLSYFM